MDLEKNADEVAALAMVTAGITVITAGAIVSMVYQSTLDWDKLLLVAGALLSPGASYLFGKSQPKTSA